MSSTTWMQWPFLITWLTLILLAAVAANVARARGRYGVRAAATTGHEAFERIFRTQMNTLEHAVAFLPALWMAAVYWSPRWAALCGALWLIGRIWYAVGYAQAASRRSTGYYVSAIGLVALIAGSAIGWVRAFAWA
jgi:glutathione S-transferase